MYKKQSPEFKFQYHQKETNKHKIIQDRRREGGKG
jgi:hypothetical protein